MKMLPIIAFLGSIFGCHLNSSNSNQKNLQKLSSGDTLSCQNVTINTINAIFVNFDSLKMVLGEPDSVFVDIDSVDSPPILYKVRQYSQSLFYFVDERLDYCVLVDSTFEVTNLDIRVGQNADDLFNLRLNYRHPSESKPIKEVVLYFNKCASPKHSHSLSGEILLKLDEKRNVTKIMLKLI